MELQQLRLFVTVAEEGHLTRAAERLFTSQPAVSAQLKALEEDLGVSLFDRTPKGMKLTPEGRELLSLAKKTLMVSEAILTKARTIKGEVFGQLSIGTNSDFGYLQVPHLMNQMRERFPNIQLSFSNSMSPDILQDIRKGVLDSGFFFGHCPHVELQVVELLMVETAVIIPSQWDERFTNASLDELAEQPWIYTTERCPFYRLMQSLLQAHHQKIAKVALVDTEDAIRECIKFGNGIALLRKDDAEKAEAEGWGRRWQGRSPSLPLSVAIKMQRMQDPAIKAWLQVMASIWPDMKEEAPRMHVV